MLPIDPVEIVWLNYFTGPRFRSILGGAIERYGRDQVAAAMIAYVRSIDPNVISIAAASELGRRYRQLASEGALG